MKILFDAAAFSRPYGGVSKYFSELISHLPGDVHAVLAVRQTGNLYLREAPFSIPPPDYSFDDFLPRIHFRGKGRLYHFLADRFASRFSCMESENQKLLRTLLDAGDYDVYHMTDPHPRGGAWKRAAGGKPVVITVHDLIPDRRYHDRSVIRGRREMLAAASHVIAVSNHTKDDLVRLYDVDPSRVSVIYHGRRPETPGGPKPYGPLAGKKYFLYVGDRRAEYKNFPFFLRAVAPLLVKLPGHELVCTGAGLSASERRLAERSGVARQVRACFVPDASMPWVYQNAACFVYPSAYEGFGLPVVDAFAAGCPVLLSRCSCFPEIGGDAALYFDDGDAGGLRDALTRILTDSGLRNRLVAAGKDRAKRFSWEKTALATAEVYRRLCD